MSSVPPQEIVARVAVRGARLARRDDRECRPYSREEQRSQAGCPARGSCDELLGRDTITRRDALQRLALAIAAAGVIDTLDAQEAHAAAHQAAAATGGRYLPKALSVHEFATLERLTDLIVPADDKPGALQAEVAPWIDTLLNVNAELKGKYAAGLAWLDTAAVAGGAKDFVSATAAVQTALLDDIAFRRNRTAGNAAGVDFFVLARRMTCDGFYTSPVGMRDVYMGNTPQAEFVVPQAAIDYVLSRSPLG